MLIQKLSDTTGINLETIRYYRKIGLLKPQKKTENGYWDYHPLDKIVLFQLKLLRLEDFSLPFIQEAFCLTKRQPKEDHALAEAQKIEDQIRELELEKQRINQRISILKLARDHFLQTPALTQVVQGYITQDKYVFSSEKNTYEMAQYCAQKLIPYSMSILFDATILNAPLTQEKIPISICLGFYEEDISQEELGQILQTHPAQVIPKGEYLMTIVRCTEMGFLDSSDLLPLQERARSHHRTFTGPTASFITQIDYSGPTPVLYLRLRCEVRGIQ